MSVDIKVWGKNSDTSQISQKLCGINLILHRYLWEHQNIWEKSTQKIEQNLGKVKTYNVYHLPTCNSIAGLGSLILILILSHIFEASTVEVSVNGSNICEWIKYLWMDNFYST